MAVFIHCISGVMPSLGHCLYYETSSFILVIQFRLIMSDKKTITCPSCQKKYRVAADLNHGRMRCSACNHVFGFEDAILELEVDQVEMIEPANLSNANQPSPFQSAAPVSPVAEPVSDPFAPVFGRTNSQPFQSNSPRKPSQFGASMTEAQAQIAKSQKQKVLFGFIAIALFAMTLMIVAGVGIWWLINGDAPANSTNSPTVAANDQKFGATENSVPNQRSHNREVPAEHLPDIKSDTTQPDNRRSNPGNASNDPFEQPSNINQNRTPVEPLGSKPIVNKRSTTNPTSNGERHYSFPTDQQVKYSYTLKTKLNNDELNIFGMSSYRRYLRGQLPPSTDRQIANRNVEWLGFTSTMTENVRSSNLFMPPSLNNGHDMGGFELDSNGQPTTDWTHDSDELLPLIMIPISRAGIEVLGKSDQTQWSAENRVTLVSIEEKDNSPVAHLRPYLDRRSALNRPGFRNLGYPYNSVQTEINSTTISRTVEYKIESETNEEIRVSKKLSIKTIKADGDSAKRSASATGYFIFDKKQQLVTKSVLKGNAEISLGQVAVKFPIEYQCTLYTGSPAVASTGSSSKRNASPNRPAKKVATPDPNLICSFGDMGWGVKSLAFSPQGMIYAGKSDRALMAFDPGKKRKLDEKSGLENLGSINCSVTSPDNRYLLSGGYSGRIEVWEIDPSGKLSQGSKFVGHSSEILAMAVSRDGEFAASGGRGKKVRLWNLKNCKEFQLFDGFKNAVIAIHISNDGKTVMATDGTTLLKADVKTGNVISNSTLGRYARKGSFSPDGKRLVLVDGYKIKLISTDQSAEESEINIGGIIRTAEFSPDMKHVFIGSRNEVTQWNITTGEKVNSFGGERSGDIISISPDGTRLASIGNSAGTTLFVFDIPGGSAVEFTKPVPRDNSGIAAVEDQTAEEPEPFSDESVAQPEKPAFLNGVQNLIWESDDLGWGVNSLAFSPDKFVYAGKMDRAIRVFDWKKARQIDEKSKLENLGQVQVSVVTPDGTKLLTGGYSGRIQVWEIDRRGKLTELNKFVGHSKEIKSIAVSPNGKWVCSGCSGGKARVWNLETCKEVHLLSFKRAVHGVRFSDDNKFVFASDGEVLGKAKVSTGKIVTESKLSNRYAHDVAFSPDCKTVAVSVGSEIKIFDTATQSEIHSLKGRGVQWALEFGPSGDYLFVGCDKVVAQWNWSRESKVNDFDVSFANINAFAISDDGRHLAAIGSSAGQKLRVFKIPE